MNKRGLVWIGIIFSLVVFYYTRNSILWNLLAGFVIFGLVILQAALSQKTKKNRLSGNIIYTIGLGAIGSLVASLFRDAFTQSLNPGMIAGYIFGFLICVVLIVTGLLTKKEA